MTSDVKALTTSSHKCEVGNRTKEAKPQDFVPNSERYYFRRDMKRSER